MPERPHHAIVLTAGLGTRLRPLTFVRAKPAIPVAGVTMIRRISSWLADAGIDDLVLNLHHLPETLTREIGDGTDLSVRVRYSWEPIVLGSAGGPRQAWSLIEADPVYVINGDTLTDVDLGGIAEAHHRSGALVTLALVPNEAPHRYGGVLLDEHAHVTGFVGAGRSAVKSFHFIGVQLAQREAFRTVPTDVPSKSIGGIYDHLLRTRRGSIRGFVSGAQFWDVGTTADYLRTSAAFSESSSVRSFHGRRSRIAAGATVTHSILWDDVSVEEGSTLDECIVADGVRIPPGRTYKRAAIVRRAPSDDLLIAPITE